MDLLTVILLIFCALALLSAALIAHTPPIRIRHPRPGTLYVVQDLAQPDLFKVGMTYRTAKERRTEIQRTMAKGRLREILRLEIPYVRDVEREAHRRLRRRQARLPGRGQEWFRAHQHTEILTEVSRAVQNVRRYARRWNPNTPIRVHLYGHPFPSHAFLQGQLHIVHQNPPTPPS